MSAFILNAALALLVAGGQCEDPLPIDPAIVTQQMRLDKFGGADQAGPACHLRWEGGSGPTLMIYGPSALASLGAFKSPKDAADQYAGESPKGVEPLPGVPNGQGESTWDWRDPAA